MNIENLILKCEYKWTQCRASNQGAESIRITLIAY